MTIGTVCMNSDLRSNFPVWSSVTVLQLHVGLLVNTVQVLVKAIQQEGQQLLGVLLLEAIEARGVLRYRPLTEETGERQEQKGKRQPFDCFFFRFKDCTF